MKRVTLFFILFGLGVLSVVHGEGTATESSAGKKTSDEAQLAGQPTGRLGVILDKRTDTVFFVENGSGAQDAGIRIGDKLLEVDGAPLVGHYDEDVKKIVGEPGSVARIKVRRGDEELVLDVVRKALVKGEVRKVVRENAVETAAVQSHDLINRGAHSYKEYVELMAEENRQLAAAGRAPKNVISQEQWQEELEARSKK